MRDLPMKNYKIASYEAIYFDKIKKGILNDEFVKNDIGNCLQKWPECALVVLDQNEPVGIGVFTGANEKTSFSVYIHEDYRRQGVGSHLMTALHEKMKNDGVKEGVCDFLSDPNLESFAEKFGYKRWFQSNYMVYEGKNIGDSGMSHFEKEGHTLRMIPYEDQYYSICQDIMSKSFHQMRLSVGMVSVPAMSSEENRQAYASCAQDIFLLADQEAVKGLIWLEDGEISSLAVAIPEQGKGYGKRLTEFGIREIMKRGHEPITLWCVEGNHAKHMYLGLGFIEVRRHTYMNSILI